MRLSTLHVSCFGKSQTFIVGMYSFCKGKMSVLKLFLFNSNKLKERKATDSVNISHQVSGKSRHF